MALENSSKCPTDNILMLPDDDESEHDDKLLDEIQPDDDEQKSPVEPIDKNIQLVSTADTNSCVYKVNVFLEMNNRTILFRKMILCFINY